MWAPYDRFKGTDLGQIVKDAIKVLPRWCKAEGNNFSRHDWVNAWLTAGESGDHLFEGKDPTKRRLKFHEVPSVLAPYQICKHCSKRSNAKD